jgi:hypothetical protein
MTRLLIVCIGALLVASCRGGAESVVLAALNRSDKIQLLCADIERVQGNLYRVEEVLPLDLCDATRTFAPGVEPQFLGAVTQTQSGEVAVVSFTNSLILDTNITVPGVTAFRVGEQPTAIQISPIEPSYTYVSSFSPKAVQAVPTDALIDGESDLPQQQIRFDAGPTDLALYELAFATPIEEDGAITGAKSDIVYRYLYAAIPELGQIAQIPVEIRTTDEGERKHGALGTPQFFALDTYDCASATLVPSPASTPDDYLRICPEQTEEQAGRFIKTVRTTATCVDGEMVGPRPVALAFDAGLEQGVAGLSDEVLLVADANQPVIHRFSLSASGATPIEPIVTGTPTIDLAVTPFVPASSDPTDLAATERYLYAVSAADSSIVTIDYTADPPGTPDDQRKFGAVLPVIAGQSPRANEENVESRNRVRSGFSNVRSIEVVAPFYDLEEDPETGGARVPEGEPCERTDDEAFALAQNSGNMRGVFLAVSLSSGLMFFLDVYDLNAPCRGGEGAVACTDAETGPDRYASIQRHRRRIGFTPSTFIAIDGTPSLQFNAAPGRLDATTGQPAGSDGPGLQFIDCPPSMIAVFGEDPTGQADGLICASSQVWSSFSQGWSARWEGLISNSEGGLGLFSDQSFDGQPGNWFLGGDVPFCAIGVLGRQSGSSMGSDLSIDRLNEYGGDRLLITGELPPDREEDPACEKFIDLPDNIEDAPVWFPIVRAFDDQLEIGSSPNPNRYTLDEVRFCFHQFTEYQVHTRGVYTVTGTTSGFIHRITADPTTNECVFDETRPVELDDVDTYLTGRAFADTLFINPLVGFQIGPFSPIVAITDSTVALLNFSILNRFDPLVLDTSSASVSLPASMLFSAQRDQLFFADLQRGIERIVFSPLSIVQSFE